ncbi:MAG: glycosyltransferase family 2 protein [Treponema sp.]|nr:glycosyltransferase family 2 protein [Treponema sp.]
MKQGFIIPVYRHGRTACAIAEKLLKFGLPVILIDDGNDADERKILTEFVSRTKGIRVARLEKNSGKGGAVIKGIETAKELCLTHVLQIDADGQHDDSKVSFFLQESINHPDKIICGYPEYDETVPKSRLNGRKISNFWAMIVTLSGELKDVLCGFRVYPVDITYHITRNRSIDRRMGFDPEIMVRLYWKEIYPVFHPIKVIYPQGGISNFNAVWDNIRISWTFTRLCIGMIVRIPILIIRKIRRRKNKT